MPEPSSKTTVAEADLVMPSIRKGTSLTKRQKPQSSMFPRVESHFFTVVFVAAPLLSARFGSICAVP